MLHLFVKTRQKFAPTSVRSHCKTSGSGTWVTSRPDILLSIVAGWLSLFQAFGLPSIFHRQGLVAHFVQTLTLRCPNVRNFTETKVKRSIISTFGGYPFTQN